MAILFGCGMGEMSSVRKSWTGVLLMLAIEGGKEKGYGVRMMGTILGAPIMCIGGNSPPPMHSEAICNR